MRLLFADAETYYSPEYTLRKLTPAEYILDARFELLGVSVAWDDAKSTYIEGPDFPAWVAAQDWTDTMVVSHNALFDACIFNWLYGIRPTYWGDTLSMANAHLRGRTRYVSLSKVADLLGLRQKGTTIINMRGFRHRDIVAQPALHAASIDYANRDNDLCRAIFLHLLTVTPWDEMRVIDQIIRAAVEPQLVLDVPLLHQHLAQVQLDKANLLQQVTASKDELMSNEKFAVMLQNLGVDPPRKVSLKTGLETWAFAKTDAEFEALTEHDDPMVQALVAARLGIKSTQEETRCARLISIGNLQWGDGTPWMPIPLKYSAAHTHRLGGTWSINLQNLKRGGQLRKALKAPPGHKVVTVDASQIEARMNAYISCETKLLRGFANGDDVYCEFAGGVFLRRVTKADIKERFLGKTCILGLGYGMGWAKFMATVAIQSRLFLKSKMDLPDHEAQRIVRFYRDTYSMIANLWKMADEIITFMYRCGEHEQRSWLGPQNMMVVVGKGYIILPNGMALHYEGLRIEKVETPEGAQNKWYYNFDGAKHMLYGAKLVENVTQALSRCHIMEAALAIKDRTGRDFVMQVHDELVYVVPDDEVATFTPIIMEEMRRAPVWAKGIPLDAEAGVGANYGEAK
jgi:DNA polymerase